MGGISLQTEKKLDIIKKAGKLTMCGYVLEKFACGVSICRKLSLPNLGPPKVNAHGRSGNPSWETTAIEFKPNIDGLIFNMESSSKTFLQS